jgi:ligand-binding sensor domain-containing protein/signal transduction histidine kinase
MAAGASRRRAAGRLARAALAAGVLAWPTAVGAERLATRRFTTADGLAGDFIISVARDSRGFLWFSTRDGLSRFDGTEFVTYGVADGLPHATINHVLETRDGIYWIGTNGGGVARFNPRGARPASAGAPAVPAREPLFVAYTLGPEQASNRVNVLFEDRRGRLWAGADDGLYRLERTAEHDAFRRVELPLVPDDTSLRGIGRIAEDAEGSLWIAGGLGLVRLLPDGRSVVYDLEFDRGRMVVSAVAFGGDGRIWLGTRGGLAILTPEPAAAFVESGRIVRRVPSASAARADRGPVQWVTRAAGLPDDHVTEILLTRDQGLAWLGTVRGVGTFDGQRVRPFGPAHGMPDDQITGLVQDAAGNIWMATVAGATRLMPGGLVSYDVADGLGERGVRSLFVDAGGRIVVITGFYTVNVLEGGRFRTIAPRVPADATCTWMSPCLYLDRDDRWWAVSETGLYAWSTAGMAAATARPPDGHQTSRDGLPDDNVFNMYVDRAKRVWVGTAQGGLAMRSPGRRTVWRAFSQPDGLPSPQRLSNRANAFAEDRAGHLWIGFGEGGLVRWREGRFDAFGPEAGVPVGSITGLLVDGAGRLWVSSTQGGIGRLDDPTVERPQFQVLTDRDGLASVNVRCLADDRHGRIYAGTSRGIDRLDPRTGAIRHFGVSEGLASDFVTAAARDAQGRLWFGTVGGLSLLDPGDGDGAAESPAVTDAEALPIFISRLVAAGAPQPVSDLGEPSPVAVSVDAGRSQLEIGFFGFSFEPGAGLKYQYRLGGGSEPWSPPSPLRSVHYARLAPGDYAFEVRAVRADGVVSARPATVQVRVLPPFYARPWFLILLGGAVAAVAFGFYRARLARLVGVERVRARIATDLHDDIGSSLSQIAILAEVVRARSARATVQAGVAEPLDRIADTSRSLVDAMGDIVWAINPRVDTLSDLVHRMRRFVEDTLGAGDLEVAFAAPEPDPDLPLGADVRREVYLILKESVTNIAKHARARRVDIALRAERRHLHLRVADDGVGFEPSAPSDGNGVASMRRRVAALGGTLSIDSRPGGGTSIALEIDMARPTRRRFLRR